MVNKLEFKKQLYNICRNILQERIRINILAVNAAQSSANEEEKSSAGDKYETTRAMQQREKAMYQQQLESNNAELAALLNLDHTRLSSKAEKGAVIQTTNHTFFIAAGLGKLMVEGKEIFFLSGYAPLAKNLQNRIKGESFTFKGEQELILDVY